MHEKDARDKVALLCRVPELRECSLAQVRETRKMREKCMHACQLMWRADRSSRYLEVSSSTALINARMLLKSYTIITMTRGYISCSRYIYASLPVMGLAVQKHFKEGTHWCPYSAQLREVAAFLSKQTYQAGQHIPSPGTPESLCVPTFYIFSEHTCIRACTCLYTYYICVSLECFYQIETRGGLKPVGLYLMRVIMTI